MSYIELLQHRKEKLMLFEYFVHLLYKWNQEVDSDCSPVYSKLQLQKLLYLACAINTTAIHHEMLDIFDRFYALPYGPVELDIYEAMNLGRIGSISIKDRSCTYENLEEDYFNDLNPEKKKTIETAISSLKELNVNYFSMSPFQLVEITHGWTAWQDAYTFALSCGSKQEPMTADAICSSEIKCFRV